MKQIYLDYNATTPLAPQVQEAMLPFLAQQYGNPSSSHVLGRAAHEAVEDARGQLAKLLAAEASEIVFTSGGTESNNLALLGIMNRHRPDSGAHLVISAFEHPAVEAPAAYLQRQGYRVSRVPCDRQGIVSPEAVARVLDEQTVLVSIMHANNEIGTIQPLAQIGELCRQNHIVFHTDASQSVGKIRTLVDELSVDLLTVAGHKMYAPKGVGALFIRSGVALEPLLHGAGHEGGLRPGTENVPSIVGLGTAAAVAQASLDEAADRLAALRDRLADQLRDALGSQMTIHGEQAERLPNTLSVAFPSVGGSELLSRAPEICASTGSACHANAAAMSSTMAALGVDPKVAHGTVRLSVGWMTSEADVDRAASSLLGAWETLQ